MEENQNWRSSIFQILFWDWKHLINLKVQLNKLFWHVILHSYLCNTLGKFFTKIESNQCFFTTYSEIKSTWSINSSKEEIVLSSDIKELSVQRYVSFWSKLKASGGEISKNKQPSRRCCTVVGLSEAATVGVL